MQRNTIVEDMLLLQYQHCHLDWSDGAVPRYVMNGSITFSDLAGVSSKAGDDPAPPEQRAIIQEEQHVFSLASLLFDRLDSRGRPILGGPRAYLRCRTESEELQGLIRLLLTRRLAYTYDPLQRPAPMGQRMQSWASLCARLEKIRPDLVAVTEDEYMHRLSQPVPSNAYPHTRDWDELLEEITIWAAYWDRWVLDVWQSNNLPGDALIVMLRSAMSATASGLGAQNLLALAHLEHFIEHGTALDAAIDEETPQDRMASFLEALQSHTQNQHDRYRDETALLVEVARTRGMLSAREAYRERMLRKAGVVQWLQAASARATDTDLAELRDRDDVDALLRKTLLELQGGRVYDAARTAMEAGSNNLALLLMQTGRSDTFQEDLKHQLTLVKDTQNADVRAILQILAGQSKDVTPPHDWRRRFESHLMTSVPPEMGFEEAFRKFKRAPQQGVRGAPPWYLDASQDTRQLARQPTDMAYHLLQAATNAGYAAANFLDPQSIVKGPMDVHIPWFLVSTFCALARRDTYKDALLSWTDRAARDAIMDQLCILFSAELEGMGCWYWSVFAVMFHSNAERYRDMPCNTSSHYRRRHLVKELLMRHLPVDVEKDDDRLLPFLVDQLRVPRTLLYECIAVERECGGHWRSAFDHFMTAQAWQRAHDILVRRIAPAMVFEDPRQLETLATQIPSEGIRAYELGVQVRQRVRKVALTTLRRCFSTIWHCRRQRLLMQTQQLLCISASARPCGPTRRACPPWP